jgi:hypothetical protein
MRATGEGSYWGQQNATLHQDQNNNQFRASPKRLALLPSLVMFIQTPGWVAGRFEVPGCARPAPQSLDQLQRAVQVSLSTGSAQQDHKL